MGSKKGSVVITLWMRHSKVFNIIIVAICDGVARTKLKLIKAFRKGL